MMPAEVPTIASVAAQLEQSPHYLRIKKLLIFTCTGTWETHPERLAAVDLRDLIAQTLTVRPTMRELRPTLEQLVHSLNKPVEYLPVAETILRSLAVLYPDEDPTEWLRTQTIRPQTAILPPQEWFDLRWELVHRTNPLRLKMLMAALLRQGDVTQAHLLLLVKGLELERLLAEVLLACPSYEELCQRLHTVAMQLEESEAYQQVVGTVTEVLAPVYQKLHKHATVGEALGPEAGTPAATVAEPQVARVSDLLQQEVQELSREAELQRLVATAVQRVVGHMEQVFRTLEEELATATCHLPHPTHYRYLREFVTQVQAMADRLAGILERLEQGDS
jgi:hypothetical protein